MNNIDWCQFIGWWVIGAVLATMVWSIFMSGCYEEEDIQPFADQYHREDKHDANS